MSDKSRNEQSPADDRQSGAEAHAERVESEDNTQVADAGIPGQIQYPDREVDAERAAAFAAGKEDSLYDDDNTNDAGKSRIGWQNPADRPTEDAPGEPGVPGDESGEETEPLAMRPDADQEQS